MTVDVHIATFRLFADQAVLAVFKWFFWNLVVIILGWNVLSLRSIIIHWGVALLISTHRLRWWHHLLMMVLELGNLRLIETLERRGVIVGQTCKWRFILAGVKSRWLLLVMFWNSWLHLHILGLHLFWDLLAYWWLFCVSQRLEILIRGVTLRWHKLSWWVLFGRTFVSWFASWFTCSLYRHRHISLCCTFIHGVVSITILVSLMTWGFSGVFNGQHTIHILVALLLIRRLPLHFLHISFDTIKICILVNHILFQIQALLNVAQNELWYLF